MNKHLKPGVAVDVRGASDEVKEQVMIAFMLAGANRDCVHGVNNRNQKNYIFWDEENDVWFSSEMRKTVISIEQALGRESEVESNELPAVGSHLEVSWGKKVAWYECVVLPSNRLAIDRYAGWHVVGWRDDYEFRPLKTEKEKFVERLVLIMNDNTNATFTEISGVLYDKDLRFIVEAKKDV